MNNFKDMYIKQMLTNNSLNIPVYTDDPISMENIKINTSVPSIYVDNENGDDNNDGFTPDTAVRTYEMGLWRASVFNTSALYLKYGQVYDFNNLFPNGQHHIFISNKHVYINAYGDNSLDKPIINYYRHIYTSDSHKYYTVTNSIYTYNTSITYENINFYLQPRDDTNISNSSGVFVIKPMNSLIMFQFCEIKSPDSWLTIVSPRDHGFGSAIIDRSTIDGDVAVIDVNMSTGSLANYLSTLKNGAKWAINYLKDSNGVPRSLVSNVML